MKRFIVAFSFLAIALAPSLADAFPNVIYNPSNGNIQFVNDTSGSLFAMYIVSPNNRITGTALPIPGAILDTADQPFGLAYINMPSGTHNAGNVIQPGTPYSELSAYFYYTPFAGPFPVGTPEPASIAMVFLGGIAVFQARRLAPPLLRGQQAARA